MLDEREAMLDEREAMFDEREAMCVPMHFKVTATFRFGCDNNMLDINTDGYIHVELCFLTDYSIQNLLFVMK